MIVSILAKQKAIETYRYRHLRSNQCFFDGKYYDLGSKLSTENDCIDCSCKVPPDFTCVQRIRDDQGC